MATNFPVSADDATTVGGDSLPAAGTELSDTLSGHPSHAVMHENVGDAIQAVEAKVGTGSSAPAADTVLTGTGSGTSSWSTVSTGMIGDGQVTEAKLAAGQVTEAKLAAGIPGVNAAGTQNTSGNAGTASQWANARTLTVDGDMTGNVSIDGSQNVTLTLAADLEAADIPDLSANKITSDTLVTDRIPDLSANKITSDTLHVDRIPDIGASKIDAGTFGTGNYTFPNDLAVNGLLNVSSQAKIEFGNSNDQIRYNDTSNEYQFWADGNQMTRLGTSIIFDTSGGSVVALSPATGAGNDAEWISYLGYYFLYRNSSTAAEKENISTDLGTHLTADMIDSVVPKMWNRITAPGIPEIGPIADEMDAVSPFLAAHGTDANDDQILTGVNKTAWMSLMTLAIQDIRTRLEAIEAA